jgi:hypothetical protein
MNKLSMVFLIFLLAVNLQASALSKAAAIQSESFRQDGRHVLESGDGENTISSRFDCLPEEFKLTDIASYRQDRKGRAGHITIEGRLIELKARCKGGRLIHGKGKEIRFFKFACYGNPPVDYDEIVQKEREELEKLQKDYTVIIIECDPRIN